MNVNQLNELLWRIDPMNTCCAVNEGMENEYLTEARHIAELLKQGQEPLSALIAVFDLFFWEGCLFDAHRKDALEQILTVMNTA